MNKKRQGNNGKVGSTLEDRTVQDISIAQDRPRQDKVGLANSRGQGRTSVRQVVEDKKAAGTGQAGHFSDQTLIQSLVNIIQFPHCAVEMYPV